MGHRSQQNPEGLIRVNMNNSPDEEQTESERRDKGQSKVHGQESGNKAT